MSKKQRSRARRKKIGRVSVYQHHGGWYVYYREGERSVRKRVADSSADAEKIAGQINAQLGSSAPTLLAFEPVTVAGLRQTFLDHHEHILRSSLATVRRYRAATQHLEDFCSQLSSARPAHEISADQFVRYVREVRVSPNGHPNSQRRHLRDKGVLFILETCRSMYGFAARRRHLPPYTENPFSGLALSRFRVENSKPVPIFDSGIELEFLKSLDDWAFPIHFVLAKTGLRPGELTHLLIQDLDLDAGWLLVRNKTALGWRIKTGHERAVPLCDEAVGVLRRVVGPRRHGVVFMRLRFQDESPPLAGPLSELEVEAERRLSLMRKSEESASRADSAHVLRAVWRDAGLIRTDAIRKSFMRASRTIGRPDMTCPKSWRHTFATLLQDAEVDPLIRQITLGHKSASDARGALGMTGVYTHTRPETQKRQIERALQLWPDSLEFARRWAVRGRHAPGSD
ncbi:MAG: tyrosine-type recombinase/integrase [Planctomycetales bacterium]